MKKLLLIMGDLATGKTTFANILSQRYNAILFFKDSIKEALGDTIGFSNRAENLKLSRASAELMYLIFRQFSKLDRDLILESNFRVSELEQLHAIASENGYQVLTLVLNGDAEVLYPRFLNRKNNENRHPVHLCGSFDTLEDFHGYLQSLRADIPGPSIRVNANDFSYQNDPALLASIDTFMDEDSPECHR